MSLKQDNAVFETEYECRNCGNRWKENHATGTHVKSGWQGVYVHACDEMNCTCCGRVECPVCGLEKPLSVSDRSPLK